MYSKTISALIFYLFFVFLGGGGGGGWALIRGWALINFSYLQGGRLFEVGRIIE